jgi:hypothetical protein
VTPNVIWWNDERGSWSCCHILNQMFDLYNCTHQRYFDPVPEGGAVIVFHGANLNLCNQGAHKAERINHIAAKLPWVIFISIGDEMTEFPLHLLEHHNKKLWVQTPLPSTKADRYLIEGYPAGTRRIEGEKKWDWCFMGQNTHERRHACMSALNPVGVGHGPNIFIPTGSFGAGLPQSEYLYAMSCARLAPCPSGPATPDTFRIWEALECGAVPIVDSRSLRDETVGFWKLVLPDNPLPLIDEWNQLPEIMDTLLADYERVSRYTEFWWKGHKMQFRDWLAKDLMALGAR